MKKLGILSTVLLTAGLLWADAPTITLDRVQQRYPWNGMVDIDFTLKNVSDSDDYYVRIKVNDLVLHEFVTDSDNLDDKAAPDAQATLLQNPVAGKHRVTWNSAWEDPEYRFFSTNATVRAELVQCDGDKTGSPYGARFTVVDLTSTPYAVSQTNIYSFADATNWYNKATYKTDKLVLRRIRAGSFQMGSPTDEIGRGIEPVSGWCYETQHPVTLTHNFLIGVFPITAMQYSKVTGLATWGYDRRTNNDDKGKGAANFVSYQDWRGTNVQADASVDATSFCGKLNAGTSLAFDLPTEAQWEYACRAGTTTSTYMGDPSDSDATSISNFLNSALGIRVSSADGPKNMSVGGRSPNAWGLYDTIGHNQEICRDIIGDCTKMGTGYDLGDDPKVDPLTAVAVSATSYCVARGGSYMETVKGNTSPYRAAQRRYRRLDDPSTEASARISCTLP